MFIVPWNFFSLCFSGMVSTIIVPGFCILLKTYFDETFLKFLGLFCAEVLRLCIGYIKLFFLNG